jgi:hypothetical protein
VAAQDGLAIVEPGGEHLNVAPVPRPQAPSVPAQPPRSDGLRVLVDLASDDGAGLPEHFLLPDSPNEAAARARREPTPDARTIAGSASVLLAGVAVVAGVYLSVIFMIAADAAAAALIPVVFVVLVWAAARRMIRAYIFGSGTVGTRGHCVALSRDDSKRIARRAAAASAELLRRSDGTQDIAFERYHRTLVSLARYELAAGRALVAERDRARLRPDDPLRSVAEQMAQDRAAVAMAHRAAARRETECLEASLCSSGRQNTATRPAKG